MVGIIILVVIALSAVFVYLDASAHEIGDISDYRKNLNKSAVVWAIATLFLWPFAFPYYLRMRGDLIRAAVEHPVRENRRSLKACGVTFAAVGFIALSVAFPGLPNENSLLSCSTPETASQDSRTRESNKQTEAIWDQATTTRTRSWEDERCHRWPRDIRRMLAGE